MITIEADNKCEGIEMYLDDEGVNELIAYLNFIKRKNESIHLTAGNELNEASITKGKAVVKHVKIIYMSE